MNYQFTRDIDGEPRAEFEMGCETFSLWFNEELGNNLNKIRSVLDGIEQVTSKTLKEYKLAGNDIDLVLDCDEVEVRSKTLDIELDDELPEGTEAYDQESMAGCGLEDFSRVLHSWHDFVVEK
ncbi:YacL family protein [Brumicola blandensis]|uniref:YacL family protein n=1 Tax=Brumicola blandensis TaxID=3075611 RepID=A0AAW8R439_9ALTE|nr:YacL family protein [Alteromonas sp. W409]MDT0584116.1 YacL family protein [Alteromonas sp. W409]